MWILEFVVFDLDIFTLEFSKIKSNKFWNFRIRIQENQFLPNLEIQIFIVIYIKNPVQSNERRYEIYKFCFSLFQQVRYWQTVEIGFRSLRRSQ